MLTSDVWTLILQQIECTQSLLKLRQVNRFSRDLLSMDFITGIPASSAQVMWNPETTRHQRIQLSQAEDIEGAIVNGGNEFWSWVYSHPIRLTQYALITGSDTLAAEGGGRGLISKRVTSFITTNSDESFLWVKITDNGLICTLSTIGSTLSTTLSVLRHMRDGQELLETVMVKAINPKQILRRSVFDDEPVEYTFCRKCLQCVSWNERSFIMMLPLDKKDEMWLMEIVVSGEEGSSSSSGGDHNHNHRHHAQWMISSIRCSRDVAAAPMPLLCNIGCVRQVRNLLYVIPEQAGSVFTMDLNENHPRLTFCSLIPELPAGFAWFGHSRIRQIPVASLMDVSENGKNFVIQDARAKQVFHLTKTTVRPLDSNRQFNLNGFSLVGNHAVICFFKDSRQYSLYNLRTKDHVKTFTFGFQPLLSLMGNDCIWSIGPTMSVYRQVAAAPASSSSSGKGDSSYYNYH